MKQLTISVASYNAEKTLKKCLDSMVKARCIDDLEIIVVNDGSKDSTSEIAHSYAEQYPQSV
ncbi:MAG: glycosyltransferase, partial [Clostridia bacterium]|nr:glycosyltransferase [Clostridia bacterium]